MEVCGEGKGGGGEGAGAPDSKVPEPSMDDPGGKPVSTFKILKAGPYVL